MADKRTQARLEKQLVEIRERPENQKCMDCKEMYPKMFNVTHNTVVCGSCANIHRELNHRIKGLYADTFDPAEVERLDKGGNQVARDTYLVGWKNSLYNEPLSTEHSRVREFMRLKYKEKRWYKPYTGPIAKPKVVDDEEEEEVETRNRSSSAPTAPQPVPAIPPADQDLARIRSQSYSTQQQQPGYSQQQSVITPDQWQQVQSQQQQQLQQLQMKQQIELRQQQDLLQRQQEQLKQQHAQEATQLQSQIQQQQAVYQQQLQQQQLQAQMQTQQQLSSLQQQQQQLQALQQQQQAAYQQQQQQIAAKQQQLLQQQQQLQSQIRPQPILTTQGAPAMMTMGNQISPRGPTSPMGSMGPVSPLGMQQPTSPMGGMQPISPTSMQQPTAPFGAPMGGMQPTASYGMQQQQPGMGMQPMQPMQPVQGNGAPVSYPVRSLESDFNRALVLHPTQQLTTQAQMSQQALASQISQPQMPQQQQQISRPSQPTSSYSQPTSTYSQPASNYSQSTSSYSQPTSSYPSDDRALVVHQNAALQPIQQLAYVPPPAMPVVVPPPPAFTSDLSSVMLECGNVLDFDEDQTLAWQQAEVRKQQVLKDEEIARQLQEKEGGVVPQRAAPAPARTASTRSKPEPTTAPAAKVFPGINSCGSCGANVRPEDMGRHRVSDCVFRPVGCPYCKKSVKYVQYQDHMNICSQKQHICHVCGLGMLGAQIPNHHMTAHGIKPNAQGNLIY